MGCDDTDPGRRGGPACDLGLCRNAKVVGERIVPAPDYPVHRGSFICMKRSTIRLARRPPKREPHRLGALFECGENSVQDAYRPVFSKSRISVSSFSSADGPGKQRPPEAS